MDKLAERLEHLEQENADLQRRIEEIGRRPAPPVILNRPASKHLNSPGRSGFFGGADYLRWAYRQPGLEYGISDIGGVQDRGAVGSVLISSCAVFSCTV